MTLHSSQVLLIELIPNIILININLKRTTGGILGLPHTLYNSFTRDVEVEIVKKVYEEELLKEINEDRIKHGKNHIYKSIFYGLI